MADPIHIAVALGGCAVCGTVGFIFGWLQGHVEAARQGTDRLYAQKQFNEARSRLVQTAAQPGPYCMGMDCVCGGSCPADTQRRAPAQEPGEQKGGAA